MTPYQMPGFVTDPGKNVFEARERFVTILLEVVPEARERFERDVIPRVRDIVSEARRRDLAASGPLRAPAVFTHTRPPLPPGVVGKHDLLPLHEAWQSLCERTRLWSLLGRLLQERVREELQDWSDALRLAETPWVSAHLLARACRACLEDGANPWADVPLEHLAPSPGVLRTPDWDRTQESEKDWKKRFDEWKRTSDSRVEKVGPRRHLDRDLKRLVRFQVLRETLQDIRQPGEDVKAIQKAVQRTADFVVLHRRSHD